MCKHSYVRQGVKVTCACEHLQDRLNHTTMAGPHDMSSNDLLCSTLWHVICMVRHRSDSDTGRFYLPLDLRQVHAPDAYFGNAHCVQSITGVQLPCMCVVSLTWLSELLRGTITTSPLAL